MEFDALLTQQQVALAQAGLPTFSITNRPSELEWQMRLVAFVDRLAEKFERER